MGQEHGDFSAAHERNRVVTHGEFGGLLSAAFDDVAVATGGGKTVLIAAGGRQPRAIWAIGSSP